MSNVPKLRFKEFSGEWKEKRLNSFSFRSAEKNRDNNINLVFTNSAVKGIVNQQDYFDKDIANQNNLEGYYIVNKDDFIYNPRISNSAPVGPLNRNHLNDKGIMSPLYTIFKMDEKKINLDFIEKFFKTAKWHKYMNSVANYGARSDRMNITNNDFFKMLIFVPLKEEQEKIASFLISVDKKIEQLTKKESLLQDYKKGVMQKIFNQEIRFKDDDGSEFCEWEQKALGNYLKHKSIKNKDKSIDLVLSVSNKKGFITQDEQFDGYEVASKDTSNYKIVNKEEYAYNPSRINVGSIARLQNFDKGIVSPMYVIFKLTNELNPIFFDNLYQTHRFKHLIKISCSGSVRDSLNFNDLANFRIKIPCIKEQTKIANFLSSMDEKILNTKNELLKIKEFKKALLQQMFV